MASIDDFDPRILSELARYTTPTKTNPEQIPPGMPDDFDLGVYRSKDATDSQTVMKIPGDYGSYGASPVWTNFEYLRRLDINLLRQNIQRYQKTSNKLLDRPAIRREIFRVLRAPGTVSIVIPFRHIALPPGLPLYRARIIKNAEVIQERKDIWTAPVSYIGAGRVNDVGEPLLYTSGDPLTALYETQAKADDLISMSLFRTTSRVLAVDMAEDITVRNLGKGDQRKLAMIMKFLIDIFSQRVPSNESFRYIAPDLVAKEIFNPYPEIYSGWCYKSVADPRGLPFLKNLALRSTSAEKLVDYKFTQIVRVGDDPAGKHDVISVLQEDPLTKKLVSVPSASG